MIKISNEDRLFTCIINGLKNTIGIHGAIYNDNKRLRSAAKRILGELKNELHNSKINNIKRVINNEGKRIEINNIKCDCKNAACNCSFKGKMHGFCMFKEE